MTNDPDVAVPLARRLLLSGAWRTVPKQGDDTDKAQYLLRLKLPAALTVLPRSAVAALTRPPQPAGAAGASPPSTRRRRSVPTPPPNPTRTRPRSLAACVAAASSGSGSPRSPPGNAPTWPP